VKSLALGLTHPQMLPHGLQQEEPCHVLYQTVLRTRGVTRVGCTRFYQHARMHAAMHARHANATPCQEVPYPFEELESPTDQLMVDLQSKSWERKTSTVRNKREAEGNQ
jgi:hypothetical protein